MSKLLSESMNKFKLCIFLIFVFPTSRVYTDVGKMSQIFNDGVCMYVARPLKFLAVIGLAAV